MKTEVRLNFGIKMSLASKSRFFQIPIAPLKLASFNSFVTEIPIIQKSPLICTANQRRFVYDRDLRHELMD